MWMGHSGRQGALFSIVLFCFERELGLDSAL